jgi:hypothetical protein
MCVDYTDLNKHCPKDPFGLPRIDQAIDSTAGCDLLCFIDCYSRYHRIAIKEEDQEKTAFITPFGVYYYTTTRLLTDKRRIPLRSASVRTPHLFHHGIPKVLVNPRSKGITSVQSTFTL